MAKAKTPAEDPKKMQLQDFANANGNTLFFCCEVSNGSMLKVKQELAAIQDVNAPLNFVLQTFGGDIDAAYRIIKLLRQKTNNLNIWIPFSAKSAGTLIALAGDKLFFSEIGEIGPLDGQVPEVHDGDESYKSALNGFKALEQVQVHANGVVGSMIKTLGDNTRLKKAEVVRLAIEHGAKTAGTLYNQLDPKVIGEYARVLEVGEAYARRILLDVKKIDVRKTVSIVFQLVYGYPSHGYVIDYLETQKIGIPCEQKNDEFMECILDIVLNTLRADSAIIKLFKPVNK
jgi:hypothetical protein